MNPLVVVGQVAGGIAHAVSAEPARRQGSGAAVEDALRPFGVRLSRPPLSQSDLRAGLRNAS